MLSKYVMFIQQTCQTCCSQPHTLVTPLGHVLGYEQYRSSAVDQISYDKLQIFGPC